MYTHKKKKPPKTPKNFEVILNQDGCHSYSTLFEIKMTINELKSGGSSWESFTIQTLSATACKKL